MRVRARVLLSLAAGLAVVAAACGGGGGGEERSEPPGALVESQDPQGSQDGLLVGEWRVYAETLFYDAGGSGGSDSSASVTRRLYLNQHGAWEFGSSHGAWYVASIGPQDWERWGVQPYGPERKIILDGWSGGTADGPIEEYEGGADFFWVIYRVEEPDPGTVQVKFGHP